MSDERPSAPPYLVQTTRLELRACTLADVDDLYPITSDPRTWVHAPDERHAEPATTRGWLERSVERWNANGLDYWLARLEETGQAVGAGGVGRKSDGAWNLYYRFTPSVWGQGLTDELCRAGVQAARANDPDQPVIA